MKKRRFGFAAVALLWLLGAIHPAAAQGVPHMEDCTKWGYFNGVLGTANTCDKPVVVRFMWGGNEHTVTRELKPAEKLSTGLRAAQIGHQWWMFTTCPAGYTSSVPFLAKNRAILIPSKYRCIRK